jgi:hypothetical protein
MQSGSAVNRINTLVKQVSSKLNIETIIKENKYRLAKMHNSHGYSEHSILGQKYQKAKASLFGNKAKIFGCLDDDYNSSDAI